jgi:hypothetical protein
MNYKRHNQGTRAMRRRKSFGYWIPKRARMQQNRRGFDFKKYPEGQRDWPIYREMAE